MRVLFEDEYLIAVHKPAGLLVHRTDIAEGQTHEFTLLLVRNMTGKCVYPLHRLDRPTSGILLLAFDEASNRSLTEDFTEHRIKKSYHALVRGWLVGWLAGWLVEESTLNHPIKKLTFDRQKRRKKRQETKVVDEEVQDAITHIRPLAASELLIPVSRYATARYSLVHLSTTNRPNPSTALSYGPLASPYYWGPPLWRRETQPLFC
jgi:tRNA pseudouridine65 synthase